MDCPHCGAEARIPQAAYYTVGEYTATCPNGHSFGITRTSQGSDQRADSSQEKTR